MLSSITESRLNTMIDDRYPFWAGKMIEYNFYAVTRVNNDMTS